MKIIRRAVLVGRIVISYLLVLQVVLVAVDRKKRIGPVAYVVDTFPLLGDEQLLSDMRRPLARPLDFYRRLWSRTGQCGRLASLGGTGCTRRLEGNKYVCLDPAVAPPFNACLVYSFGVAYDTTFEEDLWNLRRCDLFLFDPTVEPQDVQAVPPIKWHFAQVGLSNESVWRPMQIGRFGIRSTRLLLSLDVIRSSRGHLDRTIHYLKLDIEGEEWQVLPSLARSGALSTVRQLALEIHTHDVGHLPQDKWLGALQERYDALLLLEDLGFRRVHSENNTLLVSYLQLPGEDGPTPSCMELLYVKI